MKKNIISLSLLLCSCIAHSQTTEDFFKPDTKISWLGIDFTHVKLIGEFSQVSGMSETSSAQIASAYFPAWNNIILNEPEKYDLKSMLKKEQIYFDIDMIMKMNASVTSDSVKSYNTPNYNLEDVRSFIGLK